MKLIEEVVTQAPPKKVWKAWSDMYHWKSVKKGSGFVMEKTGKKVPFKIIDIKKGKGFTTVWKSFLVKMKFKYEVKSRPKGSLIKCKVNFGGMFGWIASIFLRSRIKKDLSKSLDQFASQLNYSQKQKIRHF